MEAFTSIFAVLPDPRAANARHDLVEIMFIALAATLCGVATCTDMALFAEAKEPMLRQVLKLKHGIPSHDTFSAVFRLLDPEAFAQVFSRFAAVVGAALERAPARPDGSATIAIDGKAMRHAVDKGRRCAPPVVVTAWGGQARMTMAARVAKGGNEAEAAVRLLSCLDLDGVTVTADALHCHRKMAGEIKRRGGDYVLSLKANQSALFADAEAVAQPALAALASQALADPAVAEPQESSPNSALEETPWAETKETAHDRNETRRGCVIAAGPLAVPLAAAHDFPGLAAIGIIVRVRECGTKREETTHYYVLSQVMTADRLLQVVRGHWDIENGLHWGLDMVFGEDRRRNRRDNAPGNLAMLGRLAMNVIRADQSKGSLTGKTKRAGWDNAFLFNLLRQMR